MSQAFVNEDAREDIDPRYDLPERDSPYFERAAAMAMIEGANQGNTQSAERATGCLWGEERLVPHIQEILREAEEQGEDRVAQLARRYLRQAGL